ncbi:MAG: serine/threonine protein kinase, partial [Acidobacteria bacterium]|nr:serine/threonine protein kinase [Acidobacteriota bacterium]
MFEPARLVNRREQLEDLFHAALESGPECLEWACRDDAALKAEVLELLESYRAWSGELPVAQEPALPVFGPYRCDAILGSGGMGTVYRAHRQDGEFTQEAAIKILRGSLRNDWFRQRFLVEREILAGLNHPGIARLLDGGTSADGEPYLVMELVDGGPLDEYCDAQSLSQKARLQLFLQVLDAVDYAHRNLVVHRDLKPGNILVAASGNPKLLDFGLSKLAEDDVTASIHAMTPGYASPEQLLRRPVTVASDIFSAGVVLFELLTGLSPFGAEEPWALALKRVAGEVEIRHAPELDRDLSCILRKALEHEPERRYASAKEFRDDLDRYLNARPVLARPHGLAYRAGKFVRRNRIAVTSAALVLAAAFTGASLTLWQARKAAARFAELRGFARFVVQDLHTEIQKLPGSTNLQRLSVERSLGYLDRLAAESAPDAALRIEVADGYRRLGDVLGNPYRSNLGDRGKAESAYRKGLVLLREGPKTAASRRIAAELAVQLAGTAGFGGSKGEGLAEIRRAAKELAGLAAAAQDDSALQLSAARAWEALGTRLVVGGGNIESEGSAEAEKVYRESIGLANAVLTREPANEAAKLQLVQCELNLGMLKGSDRPVDAI